MSLALATGAGAAGGLETLLARMRSEEELAQRTQQIGVENRQRQQQLDQSGENQRQQRILQDEQIKGLIQARQGQQDDRQMGMANSLADQIPAGTPLGANDKALSILKMGGRGSLLTPEGVTPQDAPEGIAAPGQLPLKAIPDTFANSPAPSLQRVVKGATQKQLDDESKRALEASQAAKAERPPAPTGAAASGEDKLTKVEHQDENGKTVVEYLPTSQLRGKTFRAPTPATTLNRVASAESVNKVADDLLAKLSDPTYTAVLGPAMGRVSKFEDFIGNPPPEYSDFVGEIESYALANMGVHGMRSAQGAQMIKQLLSGKHTPESLAATIRGLQTFSNDFVANQKPPAKGAVPPPTSTPGRVYYDANGNPVKR